MDELCNTKESAASRSYYVIIDECVSTYRFIGECQENDADSGRHILHSLVPSIKEIIMVDEAMRENKMG